MLFSVFVVEELDRPAQIPDASNTFGRNFASQFLLHNISVGLD